MLKFDTLPLSHLSFEFNICSCKFFEHLQTVRNVTRFLQHVESIRMFSPAIVLHQTTIF